jgi:hypothetical protein
MERENDISGDKPRRSASPRDLDLSGGHDFNFNSDLHLECGAHGGKLLPLGE